MASLFDEEASSSVATEVKPPAEVVPDTNMMEQMIQMGYGVNLVKKALKAVKN